MPSQAFIYLHRQNREKLADGVIPSANKIGRKFCLIFELFGLRSTVEIENTLDFLVAQKSHQPMLGLT